MLAVGGQLHDSVNVGVFSWRLFGWLAQRFISGERTVLLSSVNIFLGFFSVVYGYGISLLQCFFLYFYLKNLPLPLFGDFGNFSLRLCI